jgi:hypothetical protein
MTEVGQEGFEILWADCAEILTEGFGDSFGTLAGSTLTISVANQKSYDCIFANTGGGVEAATGTPRITPPPTDALASSPISADGSRLILLGIAGLIAIVLIVTPAPAAARRRR